MKDKHWAHYKKGMVMSFLLLPPKAKPHFYHRCLEIGHSLVSWLGFESKSPSTHSCLGIACPLLFPAALLNFIASLPSSLLEAPLGSQKILHRLVYQLPQTDDPTSTAKNVVQVEMLLHTPAPAGQGEMESALENSEDNVSISQDDTSLTCKIGTETTLNLLMPDR